MIALSASVFAKEEEPVKSGPEVGASARPYHPLLTTGKHPGQRWCMVCTNAGQGKSMVIAFVRDPKAEATLKVIKAVETTVAKHKNVGGIVTLLTTEGKSAKQAEALTGKKIVFLNAEEKAQFEALQKLAKKEKISESNLNIYTKDGPAGYDLSKEAEVTILVVDQGRTVKANIAMRKAELTEKRLEKLASEIDKTLSAK